MSNRNFKITLDPKIAKAYQIACSCRNSGKKRAVQLTIKVVSTDTDSKKLRAMFIVNLVRKDLNKRLDKL